MASTVWKGQLTFGLVSLPVRLYRAARKERVQMHYVAPVPQEEQEEEEPAAVAEAAAAKSGSRLRIVGKAEAKAPQPEPEPAAEPEPAPVISRVTQRVVSASAEEEKPLKRAELLKGHEVASGEYVTFTPQELSALRPETSQEMQIIRSVRLEEIDPVYFETSYYVNPDKGGERSYSLLYRALKETRYVAIASVAMHGREHVVVIRPGATGLLAHTMFYSDEIRAENGYEVQGEQASGKELQLAQTFIEAIAGPFQPEEFKDAQREKLEALIAAKVARREVSRAAGASGGGEAEVPGAAVPDLMEALKKSIEKAQAGKRDPGRETGAETHKARKRKA